MSIEQPALGPRWERAKRGLLGDAGVLDGGAVLTIAVVLYPTGWVPKWKWVESARIAGVCLNFEEEPMSFIVPSVSIASLGGGRPGWANRTIVSLLSERAPFVPGIVPLESSEPNLRSISE